MLLPLNGHAFDQCPELPATLFSGLNDVTGRQGNIEKRISSALLEVGKNLILENTRGPKEVAAYKKAAASVVFVMTKKVFGSGSIIDGRGHVITNWHVVKDSPEVVVVFKPKDSAELKKELAFTAKIIKINKICDLALLKINKPPKNLPHFQLGASKALSVGMDVHAIGHPKGGIWTYTKGFISQIRKGYEWTTEDNFVPQG
jgi:S1-C subfamily serine protease